MSIDSTIDVVRNLAATASRLEKEKIIADAYFSGNIEFFIGANLAYDKLISFGVAKAAEIAVDDLNPDDAGTFTFADFITLTNKLRKRELTGHAARDAIADAAMNANGPLWNHFYRRVLLKDMKIGCDEVTINKVLKRISKTDPNAATLMIPTFDCQLAHDGENASHKNKIKGNRLLDYKLDGTRTLAILDKELNKVSLYTRNGVLIETFPEVRASLQVIMEALPASAVIDGEMIHPNGFQHLMTMVKNHDRDTSEVKLAAFDILPLADFRAGLCSTPQWERHETLTLMEMTGLLRDAGGRVYVNPKKAVDLDTPEGRYAFEDFNREAIALGYEGIMVKDPFAPYEAKRTAAWLKVKPIISVSLQVVAVDEGKADGKYVGVMGALVCHGFDDGKEIQTNVGSGFSDEQRKDFWINRENIIGMVAEIVADKMTLESGSTVWSLRFPRWKGWRGTVKGEKI